MANIAGLPRRGRPLIGQLCRLMAVGTCLQHGLMLADLDAKAALGVLTL